MRTTLLRALALSAAMTALPAAAQDSESFVVQSQVAPFCSELSVSSAPMNLGSLTGATGRIVSDFAGAPERERQLAASFYCNAPSRITITADPLLSDTVTLVTDSSSFTNRIDYTATLVWDDVTGNVPSTATSGQAIDAPQANIGALTLLLSAPTVANNLRPVAGGYSGQVRLTISLTQ